MRNCLFDSGKHLDIASMPYAVTVGQGVLVGSLFGFAFNTYLISTPGVIVREGIFTHAKATGANTNWAVGGAVYWDNTARLLTGISTDNTLIGRGFAVAAVGDTTGSVVLVPQ